MSYSQDLFIKRKFTLINKTHIVWSGELMIQPIVVIVQKVPVQNGTIRAYSLLKNRSSKKLAKDWMSPRPTGNVIENCRERAVNAAWW